MQKDNLTEVERAEHYKMEYKREKRFTIVVGVLCFILGLFTAKAYYHIFVINS